MKYLRRQKEKQNKKYNYQRKFKNGFLSLRNSKNNLKMIYSHLIIMSNEKETKKQVFEAQPEGKRR